MGWKGPWESYGGLRGHVGVLWGAWRSYRELRGPIGCVEVLWGTWGAHRTHGMEGAVGILWGFWGGSGDTWRCQGAHGDPIGHMGVL